MIDCQQMSFLFLYCWPGAFAGIAVTVRKHDDRRQGVSAIKIKSSFMLLKYKKMSCKITLKTLNLFIKTMEIKGFFQF